MARTTLSSSNRSARRVEAKRQRFRDWLIALAEAPPAGVPSALNKAFLNRKNHKSVEIWSELSNEDRGRLAESGVEAMRALLPPDTMPPLL